MNTGGGMRFLWTFTEESKVPLIVSTLFSSGEDFAAASCVLLDSKILFNWERAPGLFNQGTDASLSILGFSGEYFSAEYDSLDFFLLPERRSLLTEYFP
jgi:hypothetical protein